jgi:hypothetical protein
MPHRNRCTDRGRHIGKDGALGVGSCVLSDLAAAHNGAERLRARNRRALEFVNFGPQLRGRHALGLVENIIHLGAVELRERHGSIVPQALVLRQEGWACGDKRYGWWETVGYKHACQAYVRAQMIRVAPSTQQCPRQKSSCQNSCSWRCSA